MTRRDDADDRTRRAFLGTTATLAALGMAGCSGGGDGGDGAGGGSTPTDESMSTPMPTATPTDTMAPMTDAPTDTATATDEPTATEAMAAPDVPLLNYALTLEHLENAFYREGLDEFADDELMGADVLSDFGERVRMEVPDYLRTVGAHEAAHVDALTGTVEDLPDTVVVNETRYRINTRTTGCPLIAGLPGWTDGPFLLLLGVHRMLSPLYLPGGVLVGLLLASDYVVDRLRFG